MAGGLGESPCWSHVVSLLFLQVSLWKLVVLVPELTQSCMTLMMVTLRPQVCTSTAVTQSPLWPNAKQLGESRKRLDEGVKPAGFSGAEPLSW